MTNFNHRFCKQLLDLLDKEEIVIDALYQRVMTFGKCEDYLNYSQVYLDFEVHSEGEKITNKLAQSVIVVAPLFQDNEDIRDKEGEDIIFQEKSLSTQVGR